MTTPTIADYLKYANLQMAAEAFLVDSNNNVLTAGQLLEALKIGNNHASKFTQTQADDFVDPVKGWTVLDQRVNTTAGFSGTLFKNNQTGELVVSFRSTEFIDDAVRDSLATNELEIKNTGFAWGQIADMEAWYAKLNVDPTKLAGKAFSVTGYSLGGHLATAFNLLHPGAAQQVVILDSDGKGSITLNGVALNGGDSIRPGVWQRDGVTYEFNADAMGRGRLTITSTASGTTTTVENFAAGKLGISLPGAPTPPVARTIEGTPGKDSLNDALPAGTPEGTRINDWIKAYGDADRIATLYGGNDRIEGGDTCRSLKSRRWRDGDFAAKPINDNAWRQVA